jgi:hypothetical protein
MTDDEKAAFWTAAEAAASRCECFAQGIASASASCSTMQHLAAGGARALVLLSLLLVVLATSSTCTGGNGVTDSRCTCTAS